MVGTKGKILNQIPNENQHTGDVTALLFHNDHLFSGGADGTIKIWSPDLKFLREITVHRDYILALAATSKDVLYASSRDGTTRCFRTPLKNDHNEVILQTIADDITQLIVVKDVLFSGDDKGVVTKWYHNKVGNQYNIIEEVKSMYVENDVLYTARNSDAVVTDIKPGLLNYVTKATIPGRAPLALIGPVVDGHKKYLVFTTRDGKGVTLVRNAPQYEVVWTKEDGHDWLINALCAQGDSLFTAAFDGKIKKWTDLENKAPKITDEFATGKCINAMVNGSNNSLYVGDADGWIKQITL